MKYDVFISYSRKDYTVVQKICEMFKASNISYWLDKKDINAGGEFLGDIVDAIKNSKITLFISSASSNTSIYTAKEIALAFNEGKYIIPYKIDGSAFNKKLEFVLCDLNWVEAIPFDEEKALSLVANIYMLIISRLQNTVSDSDFMANSYWLQYPLKINTLHNSHFFETFITTRSNEV